MYKALLTIFFLVLTAICPAQYKLDIVRVDQAPSATTLPLQTSFKSRSTCEIYVNGLTGFLQAKGYPAISIDSVRYDSAYATVHLYVGEYFQLASIDASKVDKKILELSGWDDRNFKEKPLNFQQLESARSQILEYLENNGYPFAKLQLDSIVMQQKRLSAMLTLIKGPLYKIDSIRQYGDAKISNIFVQRYLEIRNGSIYQKSKLQNISKKLLDLPFIEEQQSWNMTMLGTGSILNLYLKSKKSSQANVLVGFLPSNQQTGNNKLLITGEANINLRNALGSGEQIGLNWQQIQVKSPRLNLAYQQPFIFGSSFGIGTTFDLLRKDSSFLNLNFVMAVQYTLPGEQTGKIFFQNLKTNLLNIDTSIIKFTKKLPPQIDMSSVNLGVEYELIRTNYRYNPKRGSELYITVSSGTRNIRRNSIITKLNDPAFAYASLYDSIKQKSYQVRVKINAIHYFQVSQVSTIKAAITAGWFQSPSIFRNELFQIGGYKLMRGFDEESIFASQFAVSTIEYRYLLGMNSFLFSFFDAGRTANKANQQNIENYFLGAGLGMAFETKAGIFNISYASGKRDDARFDLRQSKIHIGYVNYF